MTQILPYKGDYYLWKYVPNLPAAAIFAVLFGVATGFHLYRIIRTRLWFCLPFVVGGLMEIIGYCARAAAHSQTDKLVPYLIQSLMILLPPILFAASIYMVLGRIIRAIHGEQYSLIRVNLLTKIFVLGDIVSFFVQGGGAGIMSNGSNVKMGENIIVAGLVIQIVMFALFVATAVLFQTRYQKNKVSASSFDAVGWKASMNMLYGVSALIMIRSIFRVIEFALGDSGYFLQNEWTTYVFDSVPMLTVMTIFLVWYPDNLKRALEARRTNPDATECDESRPACGNCAISSRQCSFLSSRPSFPIANEGSVSSSPGQISLQSEASPSSHQSSPVIPTCEPSNIQDANMIHMELFHHAIHSNFFDLPPSSEDPGKTMSPTMIVETSLLYPFLMNEMLAFSALHLAHLQPTKARFYNHEAVGLQTHALSIFNREMTKVTHENCMAVLVFTWFMTLHTLCETTQSADIHSFLDRFVHYMQLHRGVRAITAEAWHMMLESEMGSVLQEATRIIAFVDSGSHTNELKNCVQDSEALSDAEKRTCIGALDRIQWFLSQVSGEGESDPSLITTFLSLIAWPVIINADFLRLIDERKPEALLVLSYYSIPLHLCRNIWVIGNSGRLLIQSVRLHLHDEWHRWLDWPEELMDSMT
ncbi:RTA1-domain-containing protein [Jackrogersella minutella]|nr:RTA1-domain-containing protein [Jackrogersella minutella]